MKKELVQKILNSKSILYREPFGPNRDTLEYMLENYRDCSVIDAVRYTEYDVYREHLAP